MKLYKSNQYSPIRSSMARLYTWLAICEPLCGTTVQTLKWIYIVNGTLQNLVL